MGGQRVVLDAGTGIRDLGHWLLKKEIKHATLLLTHTHWDHINGFPFFSPAFHKNCTFIIRAGHLIDTGDRIGHFGPDGAADLPGPPRGHGRENGIRGLPPAIPSSSAMTSS